MALSTTKGGVSVQKQKLPCIAAFTYSPLERSSQYLDITHTVDSCVPLFERDQVPSAAVNAMAEAANA